MKSVSPCPLGATTPSAAYSASTSSAAPEAIRCSVACRSSPAPTETTASSSRCIRSVTAAADWSRSATSVTRVSRPSEAISGTRSGAGAGSGGGEGVAEGAGEGVGSMG